MRRITLNVRVAQGLLWCLLALPAVARGAAPADGPETAFAVLSATAIPDGRLYAPFYDYVIWPHAVAEQGTVYCVFQNSLGQPIAMSYRPADATWNGPVKISSFGLRGDDHGNPALAIDRAGHLHVFYGCHGGPLRHARSLRPHDIAQWEELPPAVPRATYPQVMRMANGELLLFYRAGGHMEPWTEQASGDDGRTWGAPRPVIEMRREPPDPLAAAYCCFLPGAAGRSVHVFWNHKDDNAAHVRPDRPHPWRPLKYPGLHEAVYRYNVYYLRRDEAGAWRSAQGQEVDLPVGKGQADTSCLVYDSGDEFTMLRTRIALDAEDRAHIRFGTGVVDWVYQPDEPLVPVRDRYARFADGAWQVTTELPADWPAAVRQTLLAPGVQAPGDGWPAGEWSISSQRRPPRPGLGCSVHLHSTATGPALRSGGPAQVE